MYPVTRRDLRSSRCHLKWPLCDYEYGLLIHAHVRVLEELVLVVRALGTQSCHAGMNAHAQGLLLCGVNAAAACARGGARAHGKGERTTKRRLPRQSPRDLKWAVCAQCENDVGWLSRLGTPLRFRSPSSNTTRALSGWRNTKSVHDEKKHLWLPEITIRSAGGARR